MIAGTDVETPVPLTSVAAQRRAALHRVVHEPDASVANRRITQGHHELSGLLAEVLGDDTGPNFHTWAVWGSREAGTTIACRDVSGLTALTTAAGAATGFGLGSWGGHPPMVGAVLAGAAAAGATSSFLRRASRHISHGNRIVLEEIGGATLDYVHAIERGPEHVARFFESFATGPTDRGGQDLLRRAFAAYDAARREPDRVRRHQLVFAGNCFAVKHEHVRLQRDIKRSLPWPFRRLITRQLLDFWVGDEHLHVAHDLEALPSPPDDTLASLVVPEALEAIIELRDPRRAPDDLAGSGAPDWSVFAHRMNYVVDLFRSRHQSPEVFERPTATTSHRFFPSTDRVTAARKRVVSRSSSPGEVPPTHRTRRP